MNPAYLIAALSSIAYGSADLAGGLAARRAAAPLVTFFSAFAALAVLLLGLPLTRGAPGPADLAWGAAAGVCGTAGATLIYKALALGPMSLASPVLCVVALGFPVVVGFALGERPSPLAWAGVALAVLAIPPLAQTGPHETPHGRAHLRKTLLVSIAAGLAAGCFLVCVARVGAGAGLVPLIVARGVAIAIFAGAFLARRLPFVPPPEARPLALAAGALDSAANVAYWFAVRSAPMSLVAALVSLAPATTVLLARATLGERWSGPQRIGLVLALASGLAISLG